MIHLIVNHNDSFVNWKQIFGQLKFAEEILNRNDWKSIDALNDIIE